MSFGHYTMVIFFFLFFVMIFLQKSTGMSNTQKVGFSKIFQKFFVFFSVVFQKSLLEIPFHKGIPSLYNWSFISAYDGWFHARRT